MKTKVFMAAVACGAALFATNSANAQEVVVDQQFTDISIEQVDCKTNYYAGSGNNWFIQVGAGINSPFVENELPGGGEKHHITVGYNAGFGKWFTPYVGWRMSFLGGPIHWDNGVMSKAKYVNGNFDIMWDMCNSIGGVNSSRVVSVVPFVGLGGTFAWDFKAPASDIKGDDGKIKSNTWTLPVSAGIQLRFRLCKYVDFFAEGRAQFYGDNFNNCAYGKPVDINISAMGGFSFNIGGAGFKSYNPCDYMGYINSLNNQINDMRGALATTAAALAVAEAQLPCPDVPAVSERNVTIVEDIAPLMATVRFTINSARISPEEKVNVYNTAQWMKANADTDVVIVGYADKETGTSAYNMTLSQKRAKAVYDMLVNEYGINPDRLSIQAKGSDVQPYGVNNWNRIVMFGAE